MSILRLRSILRLHTLVPLALCAALLCVAAPAAASTYPNGGNAFTLGPEGWHVTGASCSIPLGSCAAAGSHDDGAGNPAGSLRATTSVTLNAGGLFSSSVVFESPGFSLAASGPAAIHVDRQFSPGGLLSLAPQAEYRVSLLDKGAGTSTEVISEALGEADAAFAGKDGAASVVSGRTYALSIETTMDSGSTGLGLLGESAVRFDNVGLKTTATGTGGPPGPGGPAGVGAAGGPPGGAATTRKHVFVKVSCPRRPRRACLITAHGRIGKKARVTYRRTIRVARGRGRVVALRVKPRYQQTVLRRKRLLVVQRVRIGKRTKTFVRSRALIRRG